MASFRTLVRPILSLLPPIPLPLSLPRSFLGCGPLGLPGFKKFPPLFSFLLLKCLPFSGLFLSLLLSSCSSGLVSGFLKLFRELLSRYLLLGYTLFLSFFGFLLVLDLIHVDSFFF